MSDDLKNCPFCSGEAKLFGPDAHTIINVRCLSCGTWGPSFVAGHGGTIEEAIAAWNRRALSAEGTEPVGWQWRNKGDDSNRWHPMHEDATEADFERDICDYRPVYASPAEPLEVDDAMVEGLPHRILEQRRRIRSRMQSSSLSTFPLSADDQVELSTIDLLLKDAETALTGTARSALEPTAAPVERGRVAKLKKVFDLWQREECEQADLNDAISAFFKGEEA